MVTNRAETVARIRASSPNGSDPPALGCRLQQLAEPDDDEGFQRHRWRCAAVLSGDSFFSALAVEWAKQAY